MCIYCRLISIYQSNPPSWYRHRFITSDSISRLRERSGFLLTKEWILKINSLEPKHWRPVIIFYTFFKLALFLVKQFLVRLNSPISSFFVRQTRLERADHYGLRQERVKIFQRSLLASSRGSKQSSVFSGSRHIVPLKTQLNVQILV